MRVNFRQGIARYQTDSGGRPTFLQRSSSGTHIDLIAGPDPTVLVFAHKGATYLFTEARTVQNAWGAFTSGGPTAPTVYLYWDISLVDASLSRGFTSLPPIHSFTPPTSPAVDQHWFDLSTTCMRVWDGSRWVEKIRVFAAEYRNLNKILPYPLGSQVGLNAPVDAGNIVLDVQGKPLRMSDGTFATTTAQLSVVGLATKVIRIESDILHLQAAESIPRYHLVKINAGRRASLANSQDVTSRVAGLAVEDIYSNQVGAIAAAGLVQSDSFSWAPGDVGRPLFCGTDGSLTVTPPASGVLQQVGTVWDTDAVMVDIHPPIVIDNPFSVTPPPTVNPSAPVANFLTTPALYPLPTLSGSVPFTVTFQDTSTNSPTSLEWDFTNDGVVDSTISNPTYTYVAAGTYTVRLKATNAFGSTEKLQTFIIDNAGAATTSTNLEIRLIGPIQVTRNTDFTFEVLVRNEGLSPASSVQRRLVIPDVGSEQLAVISSPPGTTFTRDGTLLYVDLPAISSLVSGASVSQTIGLRAPTLHGVNIAISAEVSSPETDTSPADNTTAIYIPVRL